MSVRLPLAIVRDESDCQERTVFATCMSADRYYGGQEFVAKLWTESAAQDGYAMATNRKECKNLSKSLVAATLEKAKTYDFAEPKIRDREVGGSKTAFWVCITLQI